MNGTPSSILTMGLGAWGSPSLIVTLGYGIGAAIEIRGGRLEYVASRSQIQYTAPSSRIDYEVKQ